MACPEGQKVIFGAYTLVAEAEYWRENTRQCLEAEGQNVTMDVFKRVFLEKYLPRMLGTRRRWSSWSEASYELPRCSLVSTFG